ncbi:MAG: SDR family oxidoreductase [Candidatus Brocadiia bacterium]
MDENIETLIHVSNEVGRDNDLVQGGGGNTSVKTGDGCMYVKASGTALVEMKEGQGYRCVRIEDCISILDDEEIAAADPEERSAAVGRQLLEACVDDLQGRPSVETSLHALLGKVVVHTHPSLVNGVLCATEGREAVAELFEDLDPPPLYIPYTDFGYPLAVAMQEALNQYKKDHDQLPEIIFLENHGLFVSTEEPERALELTQLVFDRVETAWEDRMDGVTERHTFAPEHEKEIELVSEACAHLRRVYAEILGSPVLVRYELGTAVKRFFAYSDCHRLTCSGPMVPDQMVYCNGAPIWVESPDKMGDFPAALDHAVEREDAGAATPLCILVDGLGMFTVSVSPALLDAASATMEAVLDILVVADQFGEPRALPEEGLVYIRGSEVEKYRQEVMGLRAAKGDLAGGVAVVSGAGSGLGRGISIGLAKRGMHVILADINPEGSKETARRIREEEQAPGSGWPVSVDVTSEKSVGDLVFTTISDLGGVDLLVNCAGIAPPHPLIEFPVEDWRKTLEVNLTGYFLMAREFARVMKRQGAGGNIINLSSKSGLSASKNHSGYNATKAGEIHLARGWAQELAQYNIRVNCVCPGNVFRESNIWNEDYIKALAKKRGLEPDEVIPYYIGLTALEEEIDWDDIANAVVFLASENASKITGQILVVDAGQVFVR